MSTITKMPSFQARDTRAVLFNCAAFVVATVFAGGMWLIMR